MCLYVLCWNLFFFSSNNRCCCFQSVLCLMYTWKPFICVGTKENYNRPEGYLCQEKKKQDVVAATLMNYSFSPKNGFWERFSILISIIKQLSLPLTCRTIFIPALKQNTTPEPRHWTELSDPVRSKQICGLRFGNGVACFKAWSCLKIAISRSKLLERISENKEQCFTHKRPDISAKSISE